MNQRFRSPAWLLELFVASNLLFLVADIGLAHSVNSFGHPAEWLPLGFSALGGLAMVGVLFAPDRHAAGPRWVGEVVGWTAVAVGVGGLIFHLSGEFFQEVALASLVYSAPFVAPLAYTGLGLLLLLNRRIDGDDETVWGRWVLLLVLMGVVGNFGLSLTDHARNGFFDAREWVAVVTAAGGVGTLLVAVVWPASRAARRVAWVGLSIQVVVGALGATLHLLPIVTEPSSVSLLERLVYGPPPFAPLLFANLAVPGALGLWALGREEHHGPSGESRAP